MNQEHTFACVINCMDGRIQDAVKNYMQKHYGATYVDMVTEPGPNKILMENAHAPVIENIKKRVGISVEHHKASVVAIVGHFGCAGNPTEKEEQIQHLKEAKKIVDGFGFNVKSVPLWVEEDFKSVIDAS